MKSVPLTSRGPVDDNNFPWVASQPRSYQSKGELGFRGMRHELPNTSSHHRRSRTTGSITSSSVFEDRETVVLPKIATGRSARSAKKMWNDYETVKIKTVLQNELETPKIPPLYVPKNPKPLYKRPVDEWKPFDILHFREFAEKGEIEPDDVTDCHEFYSQVTFLRNAVRNIDGTTSYQNLCKKPRSWSEPSVVDEQPGLIAGNRLHWQSASSSLPHPRMLLPLKPGPNTKWYAWRVAAPENNNDKQKSKRKNLIDRHGAFIDTFSPRVVPHPTPATFKASHVTEATPKPDNTKLLPVPREENRSDPRSKQHGDKLEKVENNQTVEPKGLTFITESKEESVDQAQQKHENVNVSQETPKGDAAHGQVNDGAGEQEAIKNEQSEDAQMEGGEPQATRDGGDETESALQDENDEEKQNREMGNKGQESSPGEEQNGSDEHDSDPNLTNDNENENVQQKEVKTERNDNEVNEVDPEISQPSQVPVPEEDNDTPLPDTNNDFSENAEPAEDSTQVDGPPVNQNYDQEVSLNDETSEAADLPDQPEGTEEVVIPKDVEGAEASNDPDSVCDTPQ